MSEKEIGPSSVKIEQRDLENKEEEEEVVHWAWVQLLPIPRLA